MELWGVGVMKEVLKKLEAITQEVGEHLMGVRYVGTVEAPEGERQYLDTKDDYEDVKEYHTVNEVWCAWHGDGWGGGTGLIYARDNLWLKFECWD